MKNKENKKRQPVEGNNKVVRRMLIEMVDPELAEFVAVNRFMVEAIGFDETDNHNDNFLPPPILNSIYSPRLVDEVFQNLFLSPFVKNLKKIAAYGENRPAIMRKIAYVADKQTKAATEYFHEHFEEVLITAIREHFIYSIWHTYGKPIPPDLINYISDLSNHITIYEWLNRRKAGGKTSKISQAECIKYLEEYEKIYPIWKAAKKQFKDLKGAKKRIKGSTDASKRIRELRAIPEFQKLDKDLLESLSLSGDGEPAYLARKQACRNLGLGKCSDETLKKYLARGRKAKRDFASTDE